jgi:hypothetical protein
VAEIIKIGAVLIKDGTLLPEALQLETEPCAVSWRLVKNLDGDGLGRKLQHAGWTYLCLADEITASSFGFYAQRNVRRAVKRILANLNSEQFNGLEIMQVATKRFLGLPYAAVCARSRHIQESLFSLRVKNLQEWDRPKLAAEGSL